MDDRDTLAKTFTEFADTFGVKLASAKARARRGKWPKTKGADGRLRVQVPRAVLLAADGDAGEDMVGDGRRGEVAELAGQLDAARITIEERTRRIADKDREIDRLVGLVDMQKIEITKLLELLAEARAKPNLLERIPANCN